MVDDLVCLPALHTCEVGKDRPSRIVGSSVWSRYNILDQGKGTFGGSKRSTINGMFRVIKYLSGGL